MKPFLFHLLLHSFLSTTTTAATYICDIPNNGCTNGMFSIAKCECECIEPFCPDAYGDCTQPTFNCGGNPWLYCQEGVDCPWWANHQAESCTTGNVVPAGRWQIYDTREACCDSSFPYLNSNSNNCNPILDTGPPNKHPTISKPEDDEYENIPWRFDIQGLPKDTKMRELKKEMSIILNRILIRLSEKIEGLKVSNIEEKVVDDRGRRDLMQKALLLLSQKSTREEAHRRKALENDVYLYYNVYVVRDETKKFGPLIISEMRNSYGYGDVLEEIQISPDINYVNDEDVELNFCTLENGRFSNCVYNTDTPGPAPSTTTVNNNRPTISSPTTIYAPTYGTSPTNNVDVQSGGSNGDDGSGGLVGWEIFLVILLVIVVLCCVGYCTFFFCFKDQCDDDGHTTKEVNNNIYFGDDKGRCSRRTAANNNDEFAIVLAHPQDPKFDQYSFSINTYGISKSNKVGQDPTQYHPGHEDRPDPETASRSVSSHHKCDYAEEDPPLKMKRDSTMYVDGHSFPEDPPLKAKRDPTMYIEGQRQPSEFFEDEPLPLRAPTMYIGGNSVYDSVASINRGGHVVQRNHSPTSIDRIGRIVPTSNLPTIEGVWRLPPMVERRRTLTSLKWKI